MSRDYEATAEALISDVLHDPPVRALRVAGIYAALFLEEPFLFVWGGVACFVAAYLHHVLVLTETRAEDAVIGEDVNRLIGDIGLDIYRNILPDYLRFRDGVGVTGRLGEAFAQMRAADEALGASTDAGFEQMRGALVALCRVEQEEIAQPHFASLPLGVQRRLEPFYLFRLGADSAAPVLRFTGENPCNFAERWAWTEQRVLPAYLHVWRTNGQGLRAEADRLRRMSGVKLGDLPPRLG